MKSLTLGAIGERGRRPGYPFDTAVLRAGAEHNMHPRVGVLCPGSLFYVLYRFELPRISLLGDWRPPGVTRSIQRGSLLPTY